MDGQIQQSGVVDAKPVGIVLHFVPDPTPDMPDAVLEIQHESGVVRPGVQHLGAVAIGSTDDETTTLTVVVVRHHGQHLVGVDPEIQLLPDEVDDGALVLRRTPVGEPTVTNEPQPLQGDFNVVVVEQIDGRISQRIHHVDQDAEVVEVTQGPHRERLVDLVGLAHVTVDEGHGDVDVERFELGDDVVLQHRTVAVGAQSRVGAEESGVDVVGIVTQNGSQFLIRLRVEDLVVVVVGIQ